MTGSLKAALAFIPGLKAQGSRHVFYRERENEIGQSISNLIDRLGANNFYLTTRDTYSTFYKSNDRIRVYTDSDSEPIYDFKLVNNNWVNHQKIYAGTYSLDTLSQIVTAQHERFDRGEIQRLDLNDEQAEILRNEAFFRRLNINSKRIPIPPIPLNVAPSTSETKPNENMEIKVSTPPRKRLDRGGR
ncbi:MAG: hypothetical protein HC778_01190 [Chamaesiphon sp. CSU_1_12]|nr:hypothetical protein [Chamaesiphon sp. CSU_1_12]